MCLPFCCRENDPPQPQGHGVGHSDPVDHPPSSNGNGANMNKNKSDEDKNKMTESPRPTPPPQSPEYSDTEDEVPSPTPAPPSAKHRVQKTEETSVAARTPTAATKASKKVEQVVGSPSHHHGGQVAAAGVADSARTPPETQIARRGHAHEDDYGYPANPSASPTVVAVPAANNFRGDRGHGDAHHAHPYVGKDDRKTPGRTSRQ